MEKQTFGFTFVGGESNRSRSQLYSKCLLACDPTTGSWLDINGVLLSAETNEWISFPKRQNSKLQELNITINFPQVRHRSALLPLLLRPLLLMPASSDAS